MLELGADLHVELLLADIAMPQTFANAFGRVRLHLSDAVQSTPVRANPTNRPHDIFDVGRAASSLWNSGRAMAHGIELPEAFYANWLQCLPVMQSPNLRGRVRCANARLIGAIRVTGRFHF